MYIYLIFLTFLARTHFDFQWFTDLECLKWDSTKPGLWTLDWTMDWTLDSIIDSILDSIFGLEF